MYVELSDCIAIGTFVLTAISLGYTIGRNSRKKK